MENTPSMEELMKIYQRHQANKEARKAWLQTEEGKEYNRQKAREHYERHREKVLESRKKYYEENLEMMRERNRLAHQRWKVENPEKYQEQRRRAKELRLAKTVEG
jgi:chromatin remodeling complex protein RSC6